MDSLWIKEEEEQEEEQEKEKKQEKIHFAEFVSMTNVEHEKLVNTYGEDFTNQCITILDNYKGANGKRYKSDYRAILNWVVDKVKQEQVKTKQKNYNNYEQRQYSDINKFYSN